MTTAFSRLGTLGIRLVAVVVAVGLLGGAAGAFVIRSTARASLLDDIEEEHRALADRLAAVLDARVTGLRQSLLLLSNRGSVVDFDPAGVELAVALRAYESLDALSLYGPDGNVVSGASNRELVRLDSLPPRPDVFEGLEAGTTTVAVIGTETPQVEVVAPVEQPPGTIVGALVGTAPLEILAQGLQATFVGTTKVAMVTDGDGRILVHPERDRVITGETYPIAPLHRGRGVQSLRHDGAERLAALAPTTALPTFVIVEQTRSEALAAVGDALAELTIIVGLIVLLIVIAVLTLATRMLRPLGALAEAVRRIGQGDRSARAAVAGTTEVREVAAEINRMAEALQRRVSDLEAARRVLAETEAHFRATFDQGPVAMAVVSPEGRYLQVNPAMSELLGRTEHELLALTWRDLTHPDDLADSEGALAAAVETEARAYQIEKRYLHADGHSVWVLLSVGMVHVDGRATSMIAHVQDITSQRQAQEERETLLRHTLAAEERTTRVLEAAPDATIVMLADGKIAYANRQTSEMFGYHTAELVGREIEFLLPERFRERHESHRATFVTAPRLRPMGAGLALWGLRKDGSEFPVEVSLSPLEIDGESQVVASVRDVTERRRTEEMTRTLDAMRSRQRQAVEVNDNIVQGLTVAKWAFESQRLDEARRAVERTYRAAQALIQDMLREASAVDIAPGDLVRQRPAEFRS